MTKGVTVRARMSSKMQMILMTRLMLKIQLKRMIARILSGPVKSNPIARSKVKSDDTPDRTKQAIIIIASHMMHVS